MAQRHTKSRGRARPRRAFQKGISPEWLLLGIVGLILAICWLASTRLATPLPHRTRPMTMAQARASNAAVPIEPLRRMRATPFRFRGGPAAREEAAGCLATAALYEAGNDHQGQRAVIQVILNRVQAPGFPKTVCGVVYQGYSRISGCQFSFTCDGSFRRRPVHAGWQSARQAARRALAGHVFPAVGGATHYHTDWVVPYWRDSLTKVAQIGSHLFYVRGRSQAG